MKTEDLALFNTVAEFSSLTGAARVLNIPVSKVCRHVAQLEQHLGTRLFERTTRSLSLTDAGIELIHRSKKILTEIEALELSIGQLQGNTSGTVTIAAPLDFINLTCNEMLNKFYQQYPGLQLKFISYQSRLNPMEIQADLIFFVSHSNPPDSTMVGHKLSTMKRLFIASPEFIKKNPDLNHPKQLSNYPCLLSSKGIQPGHVWLWTDENHSNCINVDGPLESESNELCISAAISGQGIAWVPREMCNEQIKSGKLQLLFDGEYGTDVYMWSLFSSREYLPHRVKVVLEFFKKEIGILLQQSIE
ncbi:conserved hypothetical protein [Shewanella sediminis HAW-EB3]|uniref:HTH lysR-type domain-containing protein n=1 Tax=Shewanella sediminis (strain HAW-EB3) TaxID=425104 RepID=A8FV37_SHESH|nr:LysR family transcriptional regulator [Shewanella sediminis]ABV36710.1 conserved hypothetical protein [Shewanella sediminis HAW-EB3]